MDAEPLILSRKLALSIFQNKPHKDAPGKRSLLRLAGLKRGMVILGMRIPVDLRGLAICRKTERDLLVFNNERERLGRNISVTAGTMLGKS